MTALRALPLLAALLLAAPGGASAEEDAPKPLRFAWTVPSTGVVTETTTKKGRTGRTRYRITLSRMEQGDDLRLRISDFELLSVAGAALEDRVQRAVLSALSGAIPDLVIGPDGRLRDVVGFERVMEATLAAFEKMDPAPPAEVIEGVRRQLSSPHWVATIKQSAGDFWTCWVGVWAGLEVRPGAKHEMETSIPLPDGSTLAVPAIVERHGSAEGPAGAVKLTFTSTIEGENGRILADAITRALRQTTGREPPEGTYESMRRVVRLEVTTDPATLRPVRATSEKTTSVKVKGQPEAAQVERHEYEFAWDSPPAETGGAPKDGAAPKADEAPK